MKYEGDYLDRVEKLVAPHWGAWLEICQTYGYAVEVQVAPHWGAWIEMITCLVAFWNVQRRTPLGCVD